LAQELDQLLWIEELLPPEIEQRKTVGGVSYYLRDKLVLILTEGSKATEYRGKSYPFELWFGAFFPIEKIKQSTVCAKFPFLENHPGKKEALYLAAETEEFEVLVKSVIREINKGNPLFGAPIKETEKEKRERLLANESDEIDMSQPSTFNTGPVRKVVKKPVVKKTKVTPKKIKSDKKSENAMMMEILKRRSQ
jgi:hypothetical protein